MSIQLPLSSVGKELKLDSLITENIVFSDGSTLVTGSKPYVATPKYVDLTSSSNTLPSVTNIIRYNLFKPSNNSTAQGSVNVNTASGNYTNLFNYVKGIFNASLGDGVQMVCTSATQSGSGIVTLNGIINQNPSLITILAPKTLNVTDTNIKNVLGMTSNLQAIVSDTPVSSVTIWSITFPAPSSVIWSGLGNQSVSANTNCSVSNSRFLIPVVSVSDNLTTYEGTIDVTPSNSTDQCVFTVIMNGLGTSVVKPYYWASAQGFSVDGEVISIGVAPSISTSVVELKIIVTFQPSSTSVHRLRFLGIF